MSRAPECITQHAAGGSPPIAVDGNELRLFAESAPLVATMVAAIRRAERRVWLETYILLDDAAGQALAAALAERARAGLDVRVLYDAFGSKSTPERFFQELRSAGAQVHAFHRFAYALERGWRWFHIFNRRNHRKLLVIDDDQAFFGGMNIVDQSAVRSGGAASLPTSAGWRDVHVQLTGPAQAALVESYARSWQTAHRQRVPKRSRGYRRGELPARPEWIRCFDSGPGRNYSRAERIYCRLIDAARAHLILSMAYFLPTPRVERSLLRARRRGVEVSVVIPGQSDVKLVQWAAAYEYHKWLRHGIRIYERQECMLHSKVLVADDQWTIVGSCNLDRRSLLVNLELLGVVRSAPLAAAISQLCAQEMAQSQLVTHQHCQDRTWFQRLRNRLAYALRRWL